MKLKGPELRKPELKAPAFLADLYYDLRDRRLLPLIGLVVVAIAAVPFLLGGDVEEPPVTAEGAGAAAALEASQAKASKLTVVEANPGLRDYRKRLRGRVATDPFQQRYTAPAGSSASASSAAGTSSKGGSSSSSSEGSVTTESSTTTVEVESGGGSSGGSNGGGPSGGSGGGGKPHLVLFDFAIDARISRSGGPGDQAQQQEPVVKDRVLPQTPLPGEKAPVVTYMGPGRKEGNKATGKVLLLVSGDVRSIAGEYRCVSRAEVCQLLEVEPGFPLTFAYGDNGVHYTIKVLKIELVVTGHT